MSTAEMVCETDVGGRPDRDDVLDAFDLCLDPLKVAVARLSDQDIRRMKSRELIDVIKFSDVFSSRTWFQQLRFMDYEDLNRLAYLARRACRHEINAAYE